MPRVRPARRAARGVPHPVPPSHALPLFRAPPSHPRRGPQCRTGTYFSGTNLNIRPANVGCGGCREVSAGAAELTAGDTGAAPRLPADAARRLPHPAPSVLHGKRRQLQCQPRLQRLPGAPGCEERAGQGVRGAVAGAGEMCVLCKAAGAWVAELASAPTLHACCRTATAGSPACLVSVGFRRLPGSPAREASTTPEAPSADACPPRLLPPQASAGRAPPRRCARTTHSAPSLERRYKSTAGRPTPEPPAPGCLHGSSPSPH